MRGVPGGHLSDLQGSVVPGTTYCTACGSPHQLAGRPHSGEERKVVTVLFVDLVGFTARAERLDPEDVRAIHQSSRAGPTRMVLPPQ